MTNADLRWTPCTSHSRLGGKFWELALAAVFGLAMICPAPAAFVPDEFAHVMTITVSGYVGTTELTGFPVLVRLSEGCGRAGGFSYSQLKADGSDLAFTDAAGNEIPHDIDTWNPKGESLVWVRVPQLSGQDTRILMHFGREVGGTGTFSAADVWSAYAAVWHFNSSGTDATGHGLSVGALGGGEGVEHLEDAGILGGGYANGGAGGLALANPAAWTFKKAASQIVLTCWLKPDALPIGGTWRLASWKDGYDNASGFDVMMTDAGMRLRGSGGTASNTPTIPYSWTTAWTHIAAMYNGVYVAGYVDGVKTDIQGDHPGMQIVAGTSDLFVGNGYNGNYGLAGRLDEVRLYDGRAPDDWLRAEHDTVAVRSFVTLGAVRDPAERADCYLSPSGSDANDGLTLKTAKKTLQAAIAALGAGGGTILVDDGVYADKQSSPNMYTLDKPITVRGLSHDPDAVVFTKGTQSTRIFKLDHPDAKLQYLTVRNGGYVDTVYSGGNIYITAKGGTVEDCVVAGGCAGTLAPEDWTTGGGNIYMMAGKVSRCVVTNGHAATEKQFGTGLYAVGGVVENSLIAYCRAEAENSPTVRLAGTAKMYNCTIANNTALNYPALFFGSSDNACRVVNTACFNNTAQEPREPYGTVCNRFGGNLDHCAAAVAVDGATNGLVVEDPGFNDDFSLRSGSALIDRGVTDEAVRAMASDLRGLARVSGAAVDIGCMEFRQGEASASFAASASQILLGPEGARVVFTPDVYADGADYTCEWLFGDSDTPVVTAGGGAVEHVYRAAGDYMVKLSVKVGGQVVAAAEAETPIAVRPKRLFVRVGGGTGLSPYDTEERATGNPLTALAYAIDGCEVVVGAGEYAQSGEYLIDKAVRIVGATGKPDDVVLKAAVKMRNLTVSSAGAWVTGLTLADGSQENSYGGALVMSDGVVSNCVIRNSRVRISWRDYYVSGGGVSMSGGLLTHVKVVGAGVAVTGGATNVGINGFALSMSGGRASNCLFTGDFTAQAEGNRRAGNFVVATGGVLENCTLAGRNLRYDCQDGTHDKALSLGANAKAVNCVVAGLGFYAVDGAVPAGATPILLNDTPGERVNCVIDNDPMLFVGLAKGDFRPADGRLCDAGTLAGLVSVPEVDVVGAGRVFGDGIDIGAYESHRQGLIFLLK